MQAGVEGERFLYDVGVETSRKGGVEDQVPGVAGDDRGDQDEGRRREKGGAKGLLSGRRLAWYEPMQVWYLGHLEDAHVSGVKDPGTGQHVRRGIQFGKSLVDGHFKYGGARIKSGIDGAQPDRVPPSAEQTGAFAGFPGRGVTLPVKAPENQRSVAKRRGQAVQV